MRLFKKLNLCLGCDHEIKDISPKKNYYYGFNINIKKIYKCPHCDLGQVDNLPAPDQLQKYYNDTSTEDVIYGLNDDEITKWKSPEIEDSILKFIENKLILNKTDSLKFLDIGAGNGTTLIHVNYHTKWDSIGIEPNKSKIDTLKKLGLTIINDSFENFDSNDNQFDIIYISQVLEHVSNPQQTLKKIRKLLKVGGSLWIDVPNCNDNYFKTRITDHSPHLTFWTSKSIIAICKKLNFEVISVGSFGHDIKKKINFKSYLKREFKYYIGWILKELKILNFFTSVKKIPPVRKRIVDKQKIGKFPQYKINENDLNYEKLYLLASKK